MKYNKLVRDNIPEVIRAKGGMPLFHVAEEKEYEEKLFEKLQEEAGELLKDKNIDEVADVVEVLHAICELMGFDWKEMESVREKKAAERGRFQKKIILDES